MHFNNKFINIILLVLVFLSVNVNALVSSPTNGFVTDNANVLKDDTEEYINRYSQFLYENTKVDFYVVILKSLEDYDLALYTDYIYDNFQLNDRGILIVGSSNDRIIRIKVGEKLSYFISDEIIDEYISNYFKFGEVINQANYDNWYSKRQKYKRKFGIQFWHAAAARI